MRCELLAGQTHRVETLRWKVAYSCDAAPGPLYTGNEVLWSD
jgi:hypothetical protein